MEKSSSDSITSISANSSKHAPSRRKRKCNVQKESIFITWSPSSSFHSVSSQRPVAKRAAVHRSHSRKRRKVEIKKTSMCSILDDESRAASCKTLNAFPKITTKFIIEEDNSCPNLTDPCIQLSPHDSSFTFEEQVTRTLAALSEQRGKKMITNVAKKRVLQTSSDLKCTVIPINPTLLSLDQSSDSNVPALEEYTAEQESHSQLERNDSS